VKITAADIREKIREITAPGEFFEVASLPCEGGERLGYRNAPATLLEVVESSRQFGEQEFIVYESERYDFTGFFQEVDALAAYLQHELGIVPGDRVAIAMQNRPHWSVTCYAGLLVGATVVPFNSWGTSEDLAYLLQDSGVRCVVADERRAQLLRDGDLHGCTLLVSMADPDSGLPVGAASLDAILSDNRGRAANPVTVRSEDPCFVLYTSGSTGRPKGVLLTHRALGQAVMNMLYLGFLAIGLEGPRELRGGASAEAALLTVPLFHGTGIVAGLLLPAYVGQKVVMMRKWDVEVALQLIDREKITTLASVPAILKDLLSSPLRQAYSVDSLLRVVAAGAASPAGMADLISQEIPHAVRSAGYGMTETMAVGTAMAGVIYDLCPNSAGIPSPISEFRAVDAAGNVLAQGATGELQIRSITAMREYLNKPEATAEAFTEDGWLRTGDLGYFDSDGYLHITGRSKEIVIRGGENIAPAEIEQAAYAHPAIQECVVFGVEDERLGEELALVAYLSHGETLDTDVLTTFLRSRLADYKVPRYIAFSRRPLPRNASEKLHKLAVKTAYSGRFSS
jgi:long-chain acyl-CoA synthetase